MHTLLGVLVVMFGVATPWEPLGSGVWRAYLNDPQVSIVKIRLAGGQVVFSVEQKCVGEQAPEKGATLEWIAGEKFGKRVACDGTKYRSNQPEALEPSLRQSNLPPEVAKVLRPKPQEQVEEDLPTLLRKGYRSI